MEPFSHQLTRQRFFPADACMHSSAQASACTVPRTRLYAQRTKALEKVRYSEATLTKWFDGDQNQTFCSTCALLDHGMAVFQPSIPLIPCLNKPLNVFLSDTLFHRQQPHKAFVSYQESPNH